MGIKMSTKIGVVDGACMQEETHGIMHWKGASKRGLQFYLHILDNNLHK